MEWIADHLNEVLRWHLANPGREHDADAPEILPAAARVWGLFLALNATRSSGFTVGPIAPADIEAYARMNRTPIRPFEFGIIRSLDETYLQIVNSRPSADKKQPGEVATRPMSPALFDSLFG
jgi:hypothetical protein